MNNLKRIRVELEKYNFNVGFDNQTETYTITEKDKIFPSYKIINNDSGFILRDIKFDKEYNLESFDKCIEIIVGFGDMLIDEKTSYSKIKKFNEFNISENENKSIRKWLDKVKRDAELEYENEMTGELDGERNVGVDNEYDDEYDDDDSDGNISESIYHNPFNPDEVWEGDIIINDEFDNEEDISNFFNSIIGKRISFHTSENKFINDIILKDIEFDYGEDDDRSDIYLMYSKEGVEYEDIVNKNDKITVLK